MTLDEIEAQIEKIRQTKWDDECAHSMEDDLHQRVLRAISVGELADPKAAAELALRTLDIEFFRWCA